MFSTSLFFFNKNDQSLINHYEKNFLIVVLTFFYLIRSRLHNLIRLKCEKNTDGRSKQFYGANRLSVLSIGANDLSHHLLIGSL